MKRPPSDGFPSGAPSLFWVACSTSLGFALALSGPALSGCVSEARMGEASEAAQFASDSPLPSPKIDAVTLHGPGCPSQDAIAIAGSRNTFRIHFENFEASASVHASLAEASCTISLRLTAPDGVAYSLAGMRVAMVSRSYDDAPAEVTLFSGSSWSGTAALTDTFVANSQGRSTTRVFDHPDSWSPCSGVRALQLTTQLRVRGSGFAHARVEELSAPRFMARKCDIDAGRPEAEADAAGSSPDAAPASPDAGPARGAPDADADPPIIDANAHGGVTIDRVEMVGLACEGANAGTVVTGADRTSLEVRFDGVRLREPFASADCALWLDVTPPPGFRVAIASFDIDGSSQLPSETTAVLSTEHYLSGRLETAHFERFRYAGPLQGAFTVQVVRSDSELVFADCGPEKLTLGFQASVYNLGNEAAMFDVERLHSLRFKLQRCP